MKKHPIEALLRPPVELWTAFSALGGAIIAAMAPWALMMTESVGAATAGILLAESVIQFRTGSYILRYQWNLRNLSEYKLSAKQIQVSKYRLFLGRGFRWRQQHAQRLKETKNPQVQRYVEPSSLYQLARQLEVIYENSKLLSPLTNFTRKEAWWNPVKPLPAVGGNLALHGVELKQQDVTMDLRERVGHMLVLGTTRVGKTRFAETLITQDIARGDVVIVIDPKGDAALMKRVFAEAKRADRDNELYIFHLGYPEISCRYNGIGNFSRLTEIATRMTGSLPSEGNSAAFREFAWRFTNMIGAALVSLGIRPDYNQITRYIMNIEPLLIRYYQKWLSTAGPEGWEQQVQQLTTNINERDLPFALKGRSHQAIALVRYVKENELYDAVADGLKSAFEYDKTYFDKIVASLLPLMEKLISGKIGSLLSPDYADLADNRPILDWRQIIRRKGIVYIGLDALADPAVSAAVGNSIFADLVSVSAEIYKFGINYGIPEVEKTKPEDADPPVISVHADEFNEIIGDEFIPLLNKAGGSGFQVTAYTQTWSDVEARVGSKAKAGQIAGNFNTVVSLRVKELATAEMVTNQLDICEVMTVMDVTGFNDSADPTSSIDFTASNSDRTSVKDLPLITPANLMSLPKGQAFALLEGGNLWKIRIPEPVSTNDDLIPSNIQEIAKQMEQRYVTNDHWWVQAA